MNDTSRGSRAAAEETASVTTTQKSKVTVRPALSPKYAGLVPVTIGTFLVAGFFAVHELWSTGFFTSAFGPLEAILFYSSILFGIVTAASGVLFRDEDRAVIVQLAGAVLWSVTTVWLYLIFPFNFGHMADIVPGPLQFLLSWITQGIGRVIWAILTIGSVAFVPFFILEYFRAHRRPVSTGLGR